MYGAGHVIDMVSRMKNNRLLRKRRKFKEGTLDTFLRNQIHLEKDIDLKKISPAKLKKIQEKHRIIAEQQKRKTRQLLTGFAIFTILFIILVIIVVNG